MTRLNGGTLLLDLTPLGNLSTDYIQLPDDIVKQIKEITKFDETTGLFVQLIKPIKVKCLIASRTYYINVTCIGDDNTYLINSFFSALASEIQTFNILNDFTCGISTL